MTKPRHKVLVIGDVHAPVSHPGYRPFCKYLYRKHKCNRVMFIGDIVDWHSITFHARHPEAPGPKDEYLLAYEEIQKWYRTFPVADVCIGNHDERIIRVAESANIPSKFLRDYKDIWKTPNWNWKHNHIIDDVYYFHGTGQSGIHPAYNAAKKMLMSVVMGHVHSAGGYKWITTPRKRIFAMDTGCGIDDRAMAFAYGRHNLIRSVISAGVVDKGHPYHYAMPMGPGERYHRSKYPLGFYNAS